MHNGLQKLHVKLQTLMHGEQGQDLVEYGLLLTMISLALVSAMNGIATSIQNVFSNISGSLA